MFPFLRRFLSVVGLLAISQGLNALSLALIPVLLDPSWADSFALGLQVGTAAYGGVVLGVVYNVAIGRPGFAHWRRAAILAALFSLVLGAVTIVATVALSNRGESLTVEGIIVVAIFAVGGAGLAIGGTGGVREACLGNPARLTAVNLFPALALLIGLLLAGLLSLSPLLTATLWTVVAIAQIPWIWRGGRRAEATEIAGDGDLSDGGSSPTRRRSGASTSRHSVSLAVGVLASTVIPTLYITALTQLPAGSTAVAFVVVRIATSIVGIGVNSLLLVRYNWESGSRDIKSITTALTGSSTVLLLVSVTVWLWMPGIAGLSALIVSWIILLIAAAVSLRETNARRLTTSITVKVVIDVSLSALGCVLLFTHPSLGSYFGLLVLSQAITMLVTSSFFRFRLATALSAVGVVVAIAWVLQPLLS